MYAHIGTCMLHHTFGGKKPIFRSQFSLSITWVHGSNSDLQAWPTGTSCELREWVLINTHSCVSHSIIKVMSYFCHKSPPVSTIIPFSRPLANAGLPSITGFDFHINGTLWYGHFCSKISYSAKCFLKSFHSTSSYWWLRHIPLFG